MVKLSEESNKESTKRFCLCGCGQEVSGWNNKLKQPVRYIRGHSNRGKTFFHELNSNEKNGMWKGDNVGSNSLHQWIKWHLHKPDLCQICNIKPPYDLANVTDKYTRDFENWKYLCRPCHMKLDYSSRVRIVTRESRMNMSLATKGKTRDNKGRFC